MEIVIALWNGLQYLFGLVLSQTYRASIIITIGKPSTLSEHCLRVRVDDGPIKTGDSNHRLLRYCGKLGILMLTEAKGPDLATSVTCKSKHAY